MESRRRREAAGWIFSLSWRNGLKLFCSFFFLVFLLQKNAAVRDEDKVSRDDRTSTVRKNCFSLQPWSEKKNICPMNEKNKRKMDKTAPEIEAGNPTKLLGFKLSEFSNVTHRGPGCPPLSLEADCTWTSLTRRPLVDRTTGPKHSAMINISTRNQVNLHGEHCLKLNTCSNSARRGQYTCSFLSIIKQSV